MLADKDALATVAVRDIDTARNFYETTLGLNLVHTEGRDALEFKAGGTKLFVYVSEFAGTNQATAVTWNVGGDIEKIVRDLKAKGVSFERYDFPDTTVKDDIHISGGMKLAWFKDPDGNIIALFGEA